MQKITTSPTVQALFDAYAAQNGREAATQVWEAAADYAQAFRSDTILIEHWNRAVRNAQRPVRRAPSGGIVFTAEQIMAAASEVVYFRRTADGGFEIDRIERGPAARD